MPKRRVPATEPEWRPPQDWVTISPRVEDSDEVSYAALNAARRRIEREFEEVVCSRSYDFMIKPKNPFDAAKQRLYRGGVFVYRFEFVAAFTWPQMELPIRTFEDLWDFAELNREILLWARHTPSGAPSLLDDALVYDFLPGASTATILAAASPLFRGVEVTGAARDSWTRFVSWYATLPDLPSSAPEEIEHNLARFWDDKVSYGWQAARLLGTYEHTIIPQFSIPTHDDRIRAMDVLQQFAAAGIRLRPHDTNSAGVVAPHLTSDRIVTTRPEFVYQSFPAEPLPDPRTLPEVLNEVLLLLGALNALALGTGNREVLRSLFLHCRRVQRSFRPFENRFPDYAPQYCEHAGIVEKSYHAVIWKIASRTLGALRGLSPADRDESTTDHAPEKDWACADRFADEVLARASPERLAVIIGTGINFEELHNRLRFESQAITTPAPNGSGSSPASQNGKRDGKLDEHGWRFELATRTLSKDKTSIHLTPTQSRIVDKMFDVSNLERDDLIDAVWGDTPKPRDNALAIQLHYLSNRLLERGYWRDLHEVDGTEVQWRDAGPSR